MATRTEAESGNDDISRSSRCQYRRNHQPAPAQTIYTSAARRFRDASRAGRHYIDKALERFGDRAIF